MDSGPCESLSFYNTFLPKTLSYSTFSLEPGSLSDYTPETIALNLDIQFFEVNICDLVDCGVKVTKFALTRNASTFFTEISIIPKFTIPQLF